MRVLFLNPFSQGISGPDESLLTLLAALVPLGVEAHVVLPRPGPQVPRYEAVGARVHHAPLTVLRRGMGTGTLTLLPRLARSSAAVAAIARNERIHLTHTNMEVLLEGAVVSRLRRAPHVLHYRGNTLDEPRLVFDGLTRLWTATAERIFCISGAAADVFRKRRRGAKVEVLYNPVDLDAFRRAERSDGLRREFGAGPEQLLLGAIGRLHRRKDLATFLRAVALLAPEFPEVRAVLVGDAEAVEEQTYRREMVTLVERLGIAARVRWAGPRRDIPAVLKALDVLVLSSRHEGFGRIVAEAMAAATPMVLTREGALPELAGEGALARLALPADPADFAEKLAGLMRDSSARASLGAAAGTSVARFDPASLAARVFRTYSELLATGGGGAAAAAPPRAEGRR